MHVTEYLSKRFSMNYVKTSLAAFQELNKNFKNKPVVTIFRYYFIHYFYTETQC